MTHQIDLAEAIKEARETHGHSQGDLAYSLGCDRVTISRWERRKSRVSSIFRTQLRKMYPELAAVQ
jgi:predicted transcriptional regulator